MEDLTCESGFQIHQKLMQWIDQEEGVRIAESATLAEEDQTYATTHLGIKRNADEERKVLGLSWDIIRDEMN